MDKRSKIPSMQLYFCFVLLLAISVMSGCNDIFPAKEKQQDDGIKVLIVEFGSRTPIPNMKVTIRDMETDVDVTSASGDIEGEAIVKGLREGHQYLFVPSSAYTADSEQAKNVGKVVTVQKDMGYVVLETYYEREAQQLDVPIIMQNPEFPHGCEITALTAALNYYGLNLSKIEMAKKYLPQQDIVVKKSKRIGPDPAKAYAGDPSNKLTGTYVFAPVIAKAAKKVAKDKNTSLKATNVSGQSAKELISLVQEGVPVVVWVTLDLSKPNFKEGWWIEGTNKNPKMYRNLHTVVLTGHIDDKVIVMDPLHGYVSHNEAEFFKSYKELGSQAVAIRK
ncbi:C39 family peptidase [Viridibacillus sp. YIM B01967]|uniref:C39 family peptidase n=1 Tax=Viridibacillus soli TaxID=2798301 RepID=A0ABS1H8M9_9BACL|nr:C39 family peptidase [Viridibacillus soli]MBK3495769.1 C39 family peptidase [Viridibacillus soli]